MYKVVNRMIAFVLVISLVFAVSPVVNAAYYPDVSKGSLTREEFDSIMYVTDNGIM